MPSTTSTTSDFRLPPPARTSDFEPQPPVSTMPNPNSSPPITYASGVKRGDV